MYLHCTKTIIPADCVYNTWIRVHKHGVLMVYLKTNHIPVLVRIVHNESIYQLELFTAKGVWICLE